MHTGILNHKYSFLPDLEADRRTTRAQVFVGQWELIFTNQQRYTVMHGAECPHIGLNDTRTSSGTSKVVISHNL